MSTSSNAIVWLHLSDLHLCEPKTGWDAHSVLDPLIEDLKTMETEHGLLPQLLFFTGDAAFGSVAGASLADQYQDVETFLAEVRGAFSQTIPKENVFLVPGNHDVDRGKVTKAQTDWLEKQTKDDITQLIHDGQIDWRQYMERLATYRQFLQDNGYDHLLTDPERLLYAQVREIHGVKIGIGGFNSAWSCGRNGEKSKLWLGGDWQTGTIVNQLKKQQADLKMALIHHPPGWFVEQEDNQLRSRTERDFDFFLHGHEHQGWVNNINDKLVRIAGAACYEGSGEENGYNLVRLNLDTGTMEIWLRKFDNEGGAWIPRIIAKKTDNQGLWKLNSLTCLSSFKDNRINQAQPMATILHTVNVENMSAGDSTASPDIKKAKPINLFFSYAHQDWHYLEQLENHLSALKDQGLIQWWHDRKIIAGQLWADEIDRNLEKADVILLLISADFIASDYCREVEMSRALAKHDQGLAIVVPILLRATDLKGSAFTKLQSLPKNFRPISQWSDLEEAYVDVVNGLRELIEKIKPIESPVIEPVLSDKDFIDKVRAELKQIFSVKQQAVIALTETLQSQSSKATPEEVLIPADNFDPEKAIRFWRIAVKSCLEKNSGLTQQIKKVAHDVLGWLALFVVKASEATKHVGTSIDFSTWQKSLCL